MLFVHDATFKYDEEGHYFGTSVNNRTLERYRYISEDVSVMIRTMPFSSGEDITRYTKISSDYKVISIPNLMSMKGLLIDSAKYEKILEEELRKFDCVVARLSGMVGMIAASVCRKSKIPCIVECVGNPLDSLRYYGLKGKLIAPLFYERTKNIVRNASYVIYVTDSYLQRIYPTGGKSVGCSNVTLPILDEQTILKRRTRIAAMQPNKIVIGSAGKVDMRYKGYQYMIKAIKGLEKQNFDVRYEIAGGGDPTFLQQLAQREDVADKVVFKGVMSHEAVLEWLDTIDLYIQPSNTEGLPRALIEAMSRGCPSVGSDAGGIPELLPEKYIFHKKCVPEIITVIQHVTSEMSICSEACYKKAADYTLDRIVQKRKGFFDEFMRDNGFCLESSK